MSPASETKNQDQPSAPLSRAEQVRAALAGTLEQQTVYQAGFCGLIGQPNAGKSSLMNWLIQDKVSIVTSKPQTTRRRILGLWSEDRGQIVFVDAPGVLKEQKGLNAFLEKEAQDVIASSDVLIAVLSLDDKKKEHLFDILKMVSDSKKPFLILINKADLKAYDHRRVILLKEINEKYPGKRVFWISSKDERGSDSREELRNEILKMLPKNPGPIYDVESLTPHTSRELAAELIREQCFTHLHEEIPFGLGVRISKFEELPGLYRIYADILVGREKHKPIVIGKGASVIKSIGTGARKEMEKLFGMKTHLEIKAMVREDWTENRGILKEMGYDSEITKQNRKSR